MKKYNIILADPPWKYTQDKKSKNFRAVTSEHYETMTTEEICKLPIQSISKEDSILFMWATFPQIKEAIKVIEAWGFEYKTVGFIWIKKNKKANTNAWGMGFYTRSNAEVCLIGVKPKSSPTKLIKSHAVHQIIESKRLRHSEKPNEVREKVLELCGDMPRIELFAREKKEGWDVWGNELNNDVDLNALYTD
jgi:N6-adenosine-specific RNA methylase IME4